ncbi:MAG: cell division topological specificity factor MinE [Mariprofundaceae bacterium]|nr:cell division topological specificity factor MinE [Mariprofundaceae bacterium]
MAFFRTSKKQDSAVLAKERLQIVLTHERHGASGEPHYLAALRQELLEVISKHTGIDLNEVNVTVDRKPDKEVLEVNVVLPRR